MSLLLRNKIHRCRPLLGTYVEITVSHDDRDKANEVINRAFSAIERIQRLMSFHEGHSETSLLNRLARQEPVQVSHETYDVLTCAKNLYELSHGLFDITVAAKLIDHHLLPHHEFLGQAEQRSGRTCDIELMSNQRVRFAQPVYIDLGGIAKGFAVDKAIEALKEQGVESGLVNAGGDMRCFGDEEYPVHVRHPRKAQQAVALLRLRNRALATSANSYEGQVLTFQKSAQVQGQTREFLQRSMSVSICADSCMVADALTKIVFALEAQSTEVLSQLDASAYIIYPDDQMIYVEG